MNKEDLKFQIDQLRKDKIIYATELTAINVICLLFYLFSQTLPPNQGIVVGIGAIVVAVGYTFYMGAGNFMRLKKVKELEKKVTK